MSLDAEWAARRRAIERGGTWVNPAGARGRRLKGYFNRALTLLGVLLRSTPLWGWGQRNALAVRQVEIELPIAGLPAAFDGYRILQVSDTHLDVLPELVGVARKLLDGVEVDMLAMTGDVHGHYTAPIELSARLLAEALEGVRVSGPRLAILGNHDSVGMAELLLAQGYELLINRSHVIERDGQRLRITGLDDVHMYYTEQARMALDDHQGECRIALVHSAELADVAARAGYVLYLSGHTHGGQICLPGGRPITTQLKRCQHAAVGLWREGGMVGYTSCGLGVSRPAVRFNCRGEVTIFTLRRADNAAG